MRKLVGTALAAGFGVKSISDIEDLLNHPTPENFSKSCLAPACGLYLENLHYSTEGNSLF